MRICDLFLRTDKTPTTFSLPLLFKLKIIGFKFLFDFAIIYPILSKHSISCLVLEGELVGIIYFKATFSFSFSTNRPT
jgi:hypothetical protein